MKPLEVGVCGWCMDRRDIVRGIELACHELEVRVLQIGFFTSEALRAADPRAIRRSIHDCSTSLIGTFLGFDGEDYSSIARIAETGGYVPDADYPFRLTMTREAAALTRELGAPRLAVHAGTVPADPASPVYDKLVRRVRESADVAADFSVRLLLETGQEPVTRLIAFLAAVDRSNVRINFDPGNLVIYGTGDPVQAAARLTGLIDNVHLKDAKRSPQPGKEYGKPMPLGCGDVPVARLVRGLRATGYAGPLLVETPASDSHLSTIRRAIAYLHSMVD